MNTPVVDFINKYKDSTAVRLHVPGHKGKDSGFSENSDITEIDGADVLYHESGILKESQKNASCLFATGKTLYSAEGSSLSIRAMLALVKMYSENSGKKARIAAGRNAHKVFLTASALLDIEVDWIYPEIESCVVSALISPEYLHGFLGKCSILPSAVYVTSPDYLGNIADIKGLSEVCREYGVLLIVDNAHGAYLRFLPENRHPIFLGAHMCCDSAHKTLPVLTGGGYLHISENAPDVIAANAERAMSLFASTSPSYLILASLDNANRYISDTIIGSMRHVTEKLDKLRLELTEAGFSLMGNEPLKITLCTKKYGYTGTEFAEILRNNGIECEFSDPDYVVLMFTAFINDTQLEFTRNALLSVPKKQSQEETLPYTPECKRVLSVKEALFKPFKRVKAYDAVGKILASPSVTCPPAVPIALCGERLTKEAVDCFMYYGIEEIDIIDE